MAGVRQEENIRFLISKIGYENFLKRKLRLRLEYPEASLRELGELLSPPLTKSAVNHSPPAGKNGGGVEVMLRESPVQTLKRFFMVSPQSLVTVSQSL